MSENFIQLFLDAIHFLFHLFLDAINFLSQLSLGTDYLLLNSRYFHVYPSLDSL